MWFFSNRPDLSWQTLRRPLPAGNASAEQGQRLHQPGASGFQPGRPAATACGNHRRAGRTGLQTVQTVPERSRPPHNTAGDPGRQRNPVLPTAGRPSGRDAPDHLHPDRGDACQEFSNIYRNHRGLFVSYPDREHLDYLLRSATKERVKVIVVTDGERILGLGDQGIGDGLLPELAGIQELSRRSIERNFWRPRHRRYLRRAI